MDWIIKELQFKADIFQKTGEIVAFDAGVVKSDTAISAELQQALQVAVRPLEHIPEAQKDYHPGSDNKVVDLVHPSLFPVVYGRTRILPDKVIGLDDCLHNVGSAKLLSLPPEDQKVLLYRDPNSWRNMQRERSPYSRNFQWMPCDVKLTGNDGCRIVSYINNLHPTENRDLYGILEKIIARTIPLWDTALTYAGNKYNRIVYDQVEYLDHPDPEPKAKDEEEGSTEEFWDRHGEWEKTRPIKLPEPGIFKTRKFRSNKKANLRKRFSRNGLQVIVKLANIQLTPEKPDYDGGSWHVEGQLVSTFLKHSHNE